MIDDGPRPAEARVHDDRRAAEPAPGAPGEAVTRVAPGSGKVPNEDPRRLQEAMLGVLYRLRKRQGR